jgi:CheY-like chemotaxis protein
MASILIIDDDEQIWILLSQMLSKAGYQVCLAAEGAAGLGWLERQKMDLIILDMIMPGQEGIETLMVLGEKFAKIPVIAISGGGQIGIQKCLRLAQALGAQRTFPKPFSLAEMLEAVRGFLG